MKNGLAVMPLIITAIGGFLFLLLGGTFNASTWIVAILFSFVWSFIAFVYIRLLENSSVLIGLLVGAVSFAISLFLHKGILR